MATPVPPATGGGGAANYLFDPTPATGPASANVRNDYRNSNEMSFIILPKLQGPPTAYLENSGQTQVKQAGNKNNFNMSQHIPYYVGSP